MFVPIASFNKVPYQIPGKELSSDGGVSYRATFSNFVDTTEATILKKLLGIKLYDQFIAGLNPVSLDYPLEKWMNIEYGAQYEFGGVTYEWVGLNTLLTPYIYKEWLSRTFDNHSETGISIPKVENAEVTSPGLRMVRADNEFFKYAGNQHKVDNSLFGFLYVNSADYADWVFTDVSNMNRFQ